jgi:hypothetical protein
MRTSSEFPTEVHGNLLIVCFRCMEHAINLAAHHFIDSVIPKRPHKATMSATKATVNSGHDDSDGEEGDDSEDDDNNMDGRGAISKALALIKQVSDFIYTLPKS